MLEKSPLLQLFTDQVEDIYYAEKHVLQALPKMSRAAHDKDLAAAFDAHRKETEGHVNRLEKVFQLLDRKPETKKCEAIEGLLKEATAMMKDFKDSEALDAALIAAAQKVEHYEIATYGTLASMADQLRFSEAGRELRATLHEEKDTDHKLSLLANARNPAAAI